MICATGASIRYYDLLPESNWEVDLNSLNSQIDENTAFVLINNPSNPCGSNWSEAHLREIAAIAAMHQVVVLSDEGEFPLPYLDSYTKIVADLDP